MRLYELFSEKLSDTNSKKCSYLYIEVQKYLDINNIDQAINLLNEILQIVKFELNNEEIITAFIYNDIGNIYNSYNLYKKALLNYLLSLNITKHINYNSNTCAKLLLKCGKLCLMLDKIDIDPFEYFNNNYYKNGMKYLNESIDIIIKLYNNNILLIKDYYLLIGNYINGLQHYPNDALVCYNKVYKILKTIYGVNHQNTTNILYYINNIQTVEVFDL